MFPSAAPGGRRYPCAGLRVLEFAYGVAAPYAGSLFAGLGADVVKVEPPDGDSSRRTGPFPGDRPHPERSGTFIALNGGKRSTVVDLATASGRRRLRRLALAADVVLHDALPDVARDLAIEAGDLLAERPDLIVVAVTPFGQSGPYSTYRGSEIVYQALTGCMDITGDPEREPLVIGVPLAQVAAGQNAFVGAMAGLLGRRSGGRLIDVSVLEAMGSIMEHSPFVWAYRGKVWKRRGNWSGVAGWGLYPCADGYVGVVSGIGNSWVRFVRMLGLEDPRLLRQSARTVHSDEIHSAIFRWLEGKSHEEACRIAQEEHRLPFGFLCGPREILASEHLRRRRFLRAINQPGVGRVRLPGPPFRSSSWGWRQAPAPALGSSGPRASFYGRRRVRGRNGGGPAASSLPLEGTRVLDFGQVWAGPHCAKVLSDLGAEVIKVEDLKRPDVLRGPIRPHSFAEGCYPDNEPGDRPFDRHGYFNDRNLGKREIAVDIGSAEGKRVVMDLVAKSDVIVENFSAGVMSRIGLGYRRLSGANPRLVYLSMPANGNTGPEASYRGFGITNDLMSGMGQATGYPDDHQNLGINASDPIAGLHGTAAVLVALWARETSGKGALIDLAQRESAIRVCFQQIVDYQMNGKEPQPEGNRHEALAPQGAYPCRGEDRWLCISVPDEETWQALCVAMRRPELAVDERFTTCAARKLNEDALDREISDWTSQGDNWELMDRLQKAGVPAAAVADVTEMMENPHLVGRQFFHDVEHPRVGVRRHLGGAIVMHPPGAMPRRGPAPCFGQDNDAILREILRYPEGRIRELWRQGVVGDFPGGGRPPEGGEQE